MLEVELGAKLDAARLVRRSDLSEVCVTDAGINTREVGMIPRVEEFGPQLEPDSLADKVGVLDGREIPVLRTRSDQRIRVFGSEVADRRRKR